MITQAAAEQPVSMAAITDPDVHLMLRVADDDTAAFGELVARYQRRVLSVLHRLVHCNWHSIEDLAQDVFLRVYRARKSYVARSKFSSWLFTIVHNVALNAKRSLARRRESFLSPGSEQSRTDPFDELAGSDLQPSDHSIRKEDCGTVRDAIARLSDRQREAMVLNNLHGLSHAEIADRMCTTTEAVKSLLARGRRQLKGLLEETSTSC